MKIQVKKSVILNLTTLHSLFLSSSVPAVTLSHARNCRIYTSYECIVSHGWDTLLPVLQFPHLQRVYSI